jgi:hypothetical protein
MIPTSVRAAQLAVGEPVGRLPNVDFARPADGEAVDAEAVVDLRAVLDEDWRGCEDAEPEPGRRQLLKVVGVREERKDDVDRLLEDESRGEPVGAATYVLDGDRPR